MVEKQKQKHIDLELAEDVPRRSKKKFSLVINGLVAAVIIAILAAILVPNFVRPNCYGTLTPCKSNLKNIGTALEMYCTDWGGHYPRNLNLLIPDYLRTIPKCPEADAVTYRASFGPDVPLNHKQYVDYYLIECAGTNHIEVGVPADYPKYDGVRGLYGG